MAVPKPVAYFGYTLVGLVAMGATGMAADLSNTGFKAVGITLGIVSNDAPETSGWVQEGRRISEENSDNQPPAVAPAPPAPAG